MNDEELILKVIEKDHQAFKQLVDRYQDLVLNTCYNLIGNRQDAEDVTQEVFCKVYKSAEKFRRESKLSTWLYRIAVNESLNFIRDYKWSRWLKSITSLLQYESEQVKEVSAPESDQPDVALEEKERGRIVQKAVSSLPVKQRTVFVLHKYEGLPYQEIAGILKCSLSSVESLMHRAKLNLQTENVSSFSSIMPYYSTNYHIFTNTKLPLAPIFRLLIFHHTFHLQLDFP